MSREGTQFFSEEMFNKIRDNIDSLVIKHSCISKEIKDGYKFNKIYFSNVLGSFMGSWDTDEVIENIAKTLPKDGLIYASNGLTVLDIVKRTKGLDLDVNQSFKIMDENWNALVFRKN